MNPIFEQSAINITDNFHPSGLPFPFKAVHQKKVQYLEEVKENLNQFTLNQDNIIILPNSKKAKNIDYRDIDYSLEEWKRSYGRYENVTYYIENHFEGNYKDFKRHKWDKDSPSIIIYEPTSDFAEYLMNDLYRFSDLPTLLLKKTKQNKKVYFFTDYLHSQRKHPFEVNNA